MRISILAGLATVAVGAVTLVTAVGWGSESVDTDEVSATLEADVTPAEPRAWAHDDEAEQLVESLLDSGSPSSRRKLAKLYAHWGNDQTKVHARLAVIDALLERRHESPKGALEDLLSAVDADRELVGDSDDTIDYAADQLQILWSTPGMFEHGRDKMLSARTDKSRAVLADSLSGFAAEGQDFIDPNDQRAALLGSDLVDAHSVTQSPWAKQKIQDGMKATMGGDVARVLADPFGIKPEDLHTLQDELNGVREAVAGVDEEDSASKALGGLAEIKGDDFVNAVAAPLPGSDGA